MLKNLGNVYAIITSKGYALAQVADIEERNGIYLCRIFNKLYGEIPENFSEIINKKEDYIVQIMLPSMAHHRNKMAKLLGKAEVPEVYKKSSYTKSAWTFGGKDTQASIIYWHIVPDYKPLGLLIKLSDWITGVLKKNVYDDSWKENFKQLNPSGIWNGKYLIERLESGWSLDNWLPSDFNQSAKNLISTYRNANR